MLHFCDGVSIDTSGPLRLLHLHDGWYVVGGGLLMPANDLSHAEFLLREQLLFSRLRAKKQKELDDSPG